jgi:hypothetical protein
MTGIAHTALSWSAGADDTGDLQRIVRPHHRTAEVSLVWAKIQGSARLPEAGRLSRLPAATLRGAWVVVVARDESA